MAKLRRLTGADVIKILEELGFVVRRINGSHHHMRFERGDVICTTTIPAHGKKPLAIGTLKAIYRQVSKCIDESVLRSYFYAD